MSYIVLHENETLEDAIKSRIKKATEPVECYKVIEERMSGSGRVEYWTYPLYAELSEEIVTGKSIQHPKEEPTPRQYEDGRVIVDKCFVHAYKNYEDALEYMEQTCIGYPETRPAIYRCVIPDGATYIEAVNHRHDGNEPPIVYAASALQFCEPITQRVYGKTMPYVKMEKPDYKKKKFGIIYDESQINGDVENSDE